MNQKTIMGLLIAGFITLVAYISVHIFNSIAQDVQMQTQLTDQTSQDFLNKNK